MNTQPELPSVVPLWTSLDVRAFLRISKSKLSQMVARREIPYLRPCGVLRFDPDAIRAFARGEALKQKIVALRPPKPKPEEPEGVQ